MTRPAADLAAWVGARTGRPARLLPLAGDGGTRRYFRVADENLLALHGPNPAENLAWLRLGRHLWYKSLPLPRIHDHDLERGYFLLEDLGDERLADYPAHASHYLEAVDLLARLHREGLRGFNVEWCFQTRAYDAAMVETQEVGYFLNSFIGNYLQRPGWPRGARAEARNLARLAASRPEQRVLMHRDFQGRNLMLKNGQVHILDWQGARPGPAAYDLASLLEETPAGPLSPDFKKALVERYLAARGPDVRRRDFRRDLTIVGAARLMQALGAYAKLTLAGKPKFAAYIGPALGRLRELFQSPLLAPFPALAALVEAADRCLAAGWGFDEKGITRLR